MSAYYFTIIISTLFAIAANAANQEDFANRGRYSALTRMFLALCVLTLIFTAGLRYYVGTDYGGYYKGLTIFGNKLSSSLKELDEPILPIIANIVSLFTDDGLYFILVCSVITITLMMVYTFKYSDSLIFCVLLFVFTGNWHGTFNGVRQFLAAAIVFAGHRLILEKKFLKYLFVVFLAFCTHKSAVIMIIPYFILRNRITLKNVILLLIGTVVLSYNYETIFSFIGFLKDSEMQMGDLEYYSNSVNMLRVLVYCAPPVVILFLYSGNNPDKIQTFYINILLVNAAAVLATSNSTYLSRLGIYTNVFTPLALAKLLKFKDKYIETPIKCIVVLLYAVFWYIEVSGSQTLANFHWIWEQ